MIVLQAVRERKKIEAENGDLKMKDKLSQTGWKLKHNFMKKSNACIDDKDRIDVFTMGAVIIEKERDEQSSGSDNDCILLDY